MYGLPAGPKPLSFLSLCALQLWLVTLHAFLWFLSIATVCGQSFEASSVCEYHRTACKRCCIQSAFSLCCMCVRAGRWFSDCMYEGCHGPALGA